MTRLYLGFGTVIVAAMAASYLHLAAWLEPWMPPGWGAMSYVAALSIDGLIVAPIMARQIVGGPVPGMALPLAQWLGVVASIYVNASWGRANVAGATWADVGVGAAILPVFALVAEHAMRATLAGLQARKAGAVGVVAPGAPYREPRRRVTTSAPQPAMSQPAARPATRDISPRDKPPTDDVTWSDLVARHGDDIRAIADATGRSLRTVQRWRQAAATQ